MFSECARCSWWHYCHSSNWSIYQMASFIDLPHCPWSLEMLPQLSRQKLNEVTTSKKCLLLQDLSLLQCFNQCVTVDGSSVRFEPWKSIAHRFRARRITNRFFCFPVYIFTPYSIQYGYLSKLAFLWEEEVLWCTFIQWVHTLQVTVHDRANKVSGSQRMLI